MTTHRNSNILFQANSPIQNKRRCQHFRLDTSMTYFPLLQTCTHLRTGPWGWRRSRPICPTILSAWFPQVVGRLQWQETLCLWMHGDLFCWQIAAARGTALWEREKGSRWTRKPHKGPSHRSRQRNKAPPTLCRRIWRFIWGTCLTIENNQVMPQPWELLTIVFNERFVY